MLREPLPSRALAMLVVALVALATGASGAPKLVKSFPEMAPRKPSLPPVTVLCGAYVWLATKGDIERSRLDSAMPAGPELASRLGRSLEAKGYRVERSAFVSSGESPNPDGGTTGVFLPPFYRDSTVLRSPEIAMEWERLMIRLAPYARGAGESPAYFTEPILLCDSLGGGVLAIVTVSYYRPTSQERGEALRRFNAWQGLVLILPGPLSTVRLTLADGKSGEVLWSDMQTKAGPYSRRTLDELLAKVLDNLP